jgi:uncharacterized membrane protein (UPF0182 family)
MRFAKFFFALLFGAVFLMTLFKVLFFLVAAGLVVGTIFLAGKAFSYRRVRHLQQWETSPYGPTYQAEPFARQSPLFEQPINPRWQKQPAPGRRIEVL